MANFSGLKIFILISTVMTWACTELLDPVGGHTTLSVSLCIYIFLRCHGNHSGFISIWNIETTGYYLSVTVVTPNNNIVTQA